MKREIRISKNTLSVQISQITAIIAHHHEILRSLIILPNMKKEVKENRTKTEFTELSKQAHHDLVVIQQYKK